MLNTGFWVPVVSIRPHSSVHSRELQHTMPYIMKSVWHPAAHLLGLKTSSWWSSCLLEGPTSPRHWFSRSCRVPTSRRERSTGPWLKRLKGLDIYIPPLLTLNDQQRFTIRSGVLTGNDTRWCSASSGSPLLERTDFGTRSLQLDGPTYAPASRTMAFTPQWQRLTIFSSEHHQILIATHFPTPEGWKAELAWAPWV